MQRHIILGVHITDRVKNASDVQKLFTEFGCQIKTRLGLHEASENVCSPNGMILLEMIDDEPKCEDLSRKLKAIPGVEVQKMVFSHP